jgi:transposase
MLIEAAQHLDKHPGPLGHFFRRLTRKKNRNVAVTAGARRLAVIGWQMLSTGEPYRYAVPRTTEAKLAKLRMKATGQRRKGGVPKGQKAVAKRPEVGCSRTIKALTAVCQAEGLPAPKSLSPGEQRTVKHAGCGEFLTQINSAHVLPRSTGSSSLFRRKSHGGN